MCKRVKGVIEGVGSHDVGVGRKGSVGGGRVVCRSCRYRQTQDSPHWNSSLAGSQRVMVVPMPATREQLIT